MVLSDDDTTHSDSGRYSELEAGEVPSHLIPIEDPEEWSNYWSEELVILYHSLSDHARNAGWALLDACTFANFVEFVYSHSSRLPPPC